VLAKGRRRARGRPSKARLALWPGRPTYPSSVRRAVPVWIPTRTRIGPPASTACASRAPDSAPGAVSNRRRRHRPACPPRRRHGARTRCECVRDARECVGIAVGAELVQEPRGPLEVGEDERDGSGRQFPHSNRIRPTALFSKVPDGVEDLLRFLVKGHLGEARRRC
jgi:hypothetical protein